MAQVFSAGAWQWRNHLFTGFNHRSHRTGGVTNNWQKQLRIRLQEHRCGERGITAEPWGLHRFGVQSAQVHIPNLEWQSPHTSLLLTCCPMEETVCSHIYAFARSIPIQKMTLSEALWNFLHISHHPRACSSFNLFFQFSK